MAALGSSSWRSAVVPFMHGGILSLINGILRSRSRLAKLADRLPVVYKCVHERKQPTCFSPSSMKT